MRRSSTVFATSKVFAFVVAAALVASACGGSDGESVSSEPAGTGDSSVETTEPDRDRNVQVGGWGTDGSGVVEASVKSYSFTNITTRTFRRERIEVIDKKKYVNTRDVFVATMVGRYEDERYRVFMKVAGFDTGGDDVANYPIADFGENGVVTVDLSSDDPNRNPMPIAWSVVSRDLLVAYFPSTNEDSQDRGVVEYYDLKTGKLASTLGIDGRTPVPGAVPMQLITDLGIRRVDEFGTLYLLLAGVVDPGEETERAAVVGFTPDGTFDSFVGDDGAGVLDFGGLTPQAGDQHISYVYLTDPGVGGAVGTGVLVVSEDDQIDAGQDAGPAAQTLTFIVAREDAATKKVSLDARGSFFGTLSRQLSRIDVRNATLTSNGAMAVHIYASEAGVWWWDSEQLDHKLLLSAGSQAINDLVMPTWTTDEMNLWMYGPGGSVANVSDEGRDFFVSSFTNYDSDRLESRVCFAGPQCFEDDSIVSIDLIEQEKFDGRSARVDSMTVDESGLHMIVGFYSNRRADDLFKLVSIDPTGTGDVDVSLTLDPSFGTRTFEGGGEDFGPSLVEAVWEPRPMGAGAVGTMRFGRERKALRLQQAGGRAIDRALSLPLGIDDYSGWSGDFVVMGPNHLGLIAYTFGEEGDEERLYRVDTSNGTVDTSFGKDGYLVVPKFPEGDAYCAYTKDLSSTAGTITVALREYETIVVDGVEECKSQASRVYWQTFDANGQPIGTGLSSAEISLEEREDESGIVGDGRGNLYVMSEMFKFTEEGDVLDKTLRITKLTANGKADAAFGVNGVLVIEGAGMSSKIAVDPEGRLYVATTRYSSVVKVQRYSVTGILDEAINVETTQSTVGTASTIPDLIVPPQMTLPPKEELALLRVEAEQRKEEVAALPADDGLTVTTNKPVITSARPIKDRALTVTWAISAAAGSPYVTATAMPGGRSCTSNTGLCDIRGLDPSQSYTVTVALKGELAAEGAKSLTAKPVVSMKVGRLASPTNFVRPASRGETTWKVRGGCTLNVNNTRITAPLRPTTCQLVVTTAKFGSTPKTTKSVTIVVRN